MDIQTLTFSGAQTIANIEDSCEILRNALARCDALDVDLTAVTEADLAFAQLIIATRKSAAAMGKALRWRVAADDPMASVLARAGLETFNLLDAITAEGACQ